MVSHQEKDISSCYHGRRHLERIPVSRATMRSKRTSAALLAEFVAAKYDRKGWEELAKVHTACRA